MLIPKESKESIEIAFSLASLLQHPSTTRATFFGGFLIGAFSTYDQFGIDRPSVLSIEDLEEKLQKEEGMLAALTLFSIEEKWRRTIAETEAEIPGWYKIRDHIEKEVERVSEEFFKIVVEFKNKIEKREKLE